jgi:hypothetical protein
MRNLDRHTLVRELHVAIMYDYITKSCRTQAEVILTHVNPNVHGIGQGENVHRKYKWLNLSGSQAYNLSAD